MGDLFWDDDYAIAIALKKQHPDVDPLEVDWNTLHQWIIELPDFIDDPTVTAIYLLENIQREWYEEVAANESTA
ncbi:MAG: Fe-S cluster assembly protein IscX [Anaerolineae bacterium]